MLLWAAAIVVLVLAGLATFFAGLVITLPLVAHATWYAYRGLVEDALSLVRVPGEDLWVVQKDTNGPFAETSRVPEDVYRAIETIPGVREASPIAFQSLQFRVGPTLFRVQLVGHRPGRVGGPAAVTAGRPSGAGPLRDAARPEGGRPA